jgi:glycosyltransferase involved in cell wall biosynthesis
MVPRDDSDALAAALGGLLDDIQESRRLDARARRHVEHRFSLERIGAELRELMLGQ